MENAVLMIVGLSCVAGSALALFKLAPRNGEPGPAWMEREGAATAVSLVLIMMGTLGVGLLIKALAS